MSEEAVAKQRLDKWLFFARTVKTRNLAAKLIQSSKVRVNRIKIDKPGFAIKVGDVLTIRLEKSILVLKVAGLGLRRGPFGEAQTLYEDLTPPVLTGNSTVISSGPRPTKRDRRHLLRFLKQEM
ncbi:RNA-binding S4 domain-containing protein [uncultured Bartonella sp.]|uniref:RNA-binding S4 domain-containing protein n=1 Tax=uncultured Bartonella sp. TaxID=104108 RepID=UPI00260AE8FA|nr:RNA-binding S4 domain-containing protein [uncultured Bartonella sp.]